MWYLRPYHTKTFLRIFECIYSIFNSVGGNHLPYQHITSSSHTWGDSKDKVHLGAIWGVHVETVLMLFSYTPELTNVPRPLCNPNLRSVQYIFPLPIGRYFIILLQRNYHILCMFFTSAFYPKIVKH